MSWQCVHVRSVRDAARPVQVAFETVMVVRDLFTGGKRSFATTADAREFRAKVYAAHGLRLPSQAPGSKPPQVSHCVSRPLRTPTGGLHLRR